METSPAACVSLIHGYLANKFLLVGLARRLRRRGFRPQPWGYWNMQCSVLVHGERFARELEKLDADPTVGTVHVVTHSMGGIVARAALDRYRPRKLGRLVMLAPPNRGSFVATAARTTFGRLLKPVAELSTDPESLVNRLPMPAGPSRAWCAPCRWPSPTMSTRRARGRRRCSPCTTRCPATRR